MASIGRVKPYVFSGTDPDPNLVILTAPGFPPPQDKPQPSDLYIDKTVPTASKLWVYGFIADPTTPSWTLASSGATGTDEVWLGPDEPADPALELWVDTDEIGTADDEVTLSPTVPVEPNEFEIWVDTSVAPPVIKIKDPVLGWTAVSTGGEVAVAPVDPYITDPNSTAELWHDTADDPGTFKARVNGTWQNITQREVFVDDEDPLTRPNPSPEAELWYDTSVTPHVLKANVDGTWETVTSQEEPHSEVSVSLAQPRTDGSTELWVDTGELPGKLKYNDPDTNAWITIAGGHNEVYVGATDPFSVSPNATSEVWYDTNTDLLKVRVNNAWVTVSGSVEPPLDEVWVGAGPPDPVAGYEIWVDNTVDPATLHFKHSNGQWIPLGGAEREVSVSDTDPHTTEPATEIWYDTAAVDAPLGTGVLKVNVGGVWQTVTSQEVFVDDEDPLTKDNPEAEIWYDTLATDALPGTGILKVNIGGAWHVATPEEVFVDDEDPLLGGNVEAELWFDTSVTPHVLKANVNGTWETITGAQTDAPDEVLVSPAEPRDVTTEIWVDTTDDPPVLKANVDGDWVVVGSSTSEVEVVDVDPYTTDPDSEAELWWDTTINRLMVRVNDDWRPANDIPPNEVFVGDTTPNPDVELWFDTSTAPAILKAKVDGNWVPVDTASEPPLDEVWVGQQSPDPAGTYEVWYDTNTEPGVLKIKRENGVWEEAGGADEVFIGDTTPAADIELWFDTTDDPGTLKAWVNGAWVSVGAREVWVDDEDPYLRANNPAINEEAELWYDTTSDPGMLRVRHNGVWINVTQREVWVDDQDPYQRATDPALNEEAELWFDTGDSPGTLKVRHNGAWINATAREVWVDDEDPYLRATNPATDNEAELWYDTRDVPGTLKVRHNGAWINATAREVWVDDEDPYTRTVNPAVNEEAELWYDTTDDPGTLKVRHNAAWVNVTQREVFVDDEDPLTRPNPSPEAEIWYDTLATDALPGTGILKVNVGGVWHVATPEEVFVDDEDPLLGGNTEAELWFDVSVTPGVLKANVSGTWVPVGPAVADIPNEVSISPAQPADITTEVWVDTTTLPPVLKANVNGTWMPIADTEVEVGVSDPYLTPQGSSAELWHDTSLGQNGMLKVRIGNNWRPVGELAPDEVHVSDTDPIDFNPQAEMWVDTSQTPPVLWARVNNGWVSVGSDTTSVPEEVNIGPVDPRDATVELWYDTSNTPGTLKANNFGTWEPITGPREVWVDDQDPYLRPTDPARDEEAELWYDTNDDPGTLKVRHNGVWVNATTREVWVDDEDPYLRVVNPAVNEEAELWYDTTDDPGTLKVRHNGAWVDVTQREVFVDDEDPLTRPTPSPEAEIWYDTLATDAAPGTGILKVNVGGTWHVATPEEVFVDDEDPLLGGNTEAELWFDTSVTPGVLKANVGGTWVEVSSPAPDPAPDEVSIASVPPRDIQTELWVDTGEDAPSNDEVYVGDEDPDVLEPGTNRELWYDTNAVSTRAADIPEIYIGEVDPANATDGQVKVWINPQTSTTFWWNVDHWVSVTDTADEVYVGPEDPDTLDTARRELWYDTDDPADVAAGGVGLPPGGTTGQAATKVDDTDGNVEWSGPHLPLTGGTVTGPVTADGTITANAGIVMGAGDRIDFPNETGRKILLYKGSDSAANSFGIGVESGTTVLHVPAANKVAFRASGSAGSNGTEWAFVDANGLGPRTNTNVSWQNGFTGTAQFRVNPAMVTLALWEFTNGVELFSFNPVKMFDYPAGVPAPWANCSGAVMPVWMGSTYGYLPLRVDCRTDGVFMYAADYFEPGDLWECACTITWAR